MLGLNKIGSHETSPHMDRLARTGDTVFLEESLVSDIPAGDGKIANLFFTAYRRETASAVMAWGGGVKTTGNNNY
jgi:hypothetical protein